MLYVNFINKAGGKKWIWQNSREYYECVPFLRNLLQDELYPTKIRLGKFCKRTEREHFIYWIVEVKLKQDCGCGVRNSKYYMFWQSGKNAAKNWKERGEKKEESKIRSLIVNRGGSQRLPFQTASKRLSKIKGTIRIKIQTFPNTKKCLKKQREHRKIQ